MNVNQNWNNNKCHCEYKNSIRHCVYKDDYVWNTSICNCDVDEYTENYAYMKSYDSVIRCDDIIHAIAKLTC